jgi:hypothetical protein
MGHGPCPTSVVTTPTVVELAGTKGNYASSTRVTQCHLGLPIGYMVWVPLQLGGQLRSSAQAWRRRATACRGVPVFDNYSDSDNDPDSFSGSHLGLTITTMPQGQFMYWKGLEPSELLEYDSRLVAFTQELPFQEGKPLSRLKRKRAA